MIFLSLFIRAGKLCLYNLSKLVRAKFFVLKGSTGGGFWTLKKCLVESLKTVKKIL